MHLALSSATWRRALTLPLTLLSQAEGLEYFLSRDCCCCAMQWIRQAYCGQAESTAAELPGASHLRKRLKIIMNLLG